MNHEIFAAFALAYLSWIVASMGYALCTAKHYGMEEHRIEFVAFSPFIIPALLADRIKQRMKKS